MKKTFGFGSRVKPFAQQKWFLVASKTKCSEHSRKGINGLVPFLGLGSFISLFFSLILFFFSPFMQSPSRVQYLKILTIIFRFLGFSLVIFSAKELFQ